VSRSLQRSRDSAYAAALWGIVFAAPHFLWALGYLRPALRFSLGTPPGPQEEALIDDVRFRAAGLWGVAALCLAASGAALATVRPWGRRLPRWLPVTGAAGVSAILGARGLVLPGIVGSLHHHLMANGSPSGAIDPDWMRWNLILWSPWFLTGAVLFGHCALGSHRAGAEGAR
jgi:hypothetical protein